MLDDLFRLHEARWRSRGEAGVLADPAVQEFHRDAAPALAAEGMLRLYRMRIGEAVAAVYYGFAWRGRSYAYIGGFDPEMPRLSPGALILRHAIGAAIAEGCAEFDFLRGGEGYKYAWGASIAGTRHGLGGADEPGERCRIARARCVSQRRHLGRDRA